MTEGLSDGGMEGRRERKRPLTNMTYRSTCFDFFLNTLESLMTIVIISVTLEMEVRLTKMMKGPRINRHCGVYEYIMKVLEEWILVHDMVVLSCPGGLCLCACLRSQLS